MRFIQRQLDEKALNDKHIFIAVSISGIKYGRVSSAGFSFNFNNKRYDEKELCDSSQLNRMKVGDIYLARFNKEIEFSELMCNCKLSKTDVDKIWMKFPGCKS